MKMTVPSVYPSPLARLLHYLVAGVVDHPEKIRLSRVETPKVDIFYLTVAKEDLGRLLGRGGRTVDAIRAVLEVVAARHGKEAIVDVVEPRSRPRPRRRMGTARRRDRGRGRDRR